MECFVAKFEHFNNFAILIRTSIPKGTFELLFLIVRQFMIFVIAVLKCLQLH